MRRSIVITKAATPAAVDNGAPELAGVSAALSAGSVGVSGAAWNLPATISVQQDGVVGLRQYALNAGAHTISVSGLPTGVTYNAGLEQLEGASTGTASATVTFTLTLGSATVQTTATVSLVTASGYTIANAIAGLPFAISTPTAPTIVDEVTVTPATFASSNENGRRLILTAGNYVDIGISGSDKEIVFTTGVIIRSLNVSGQRIVIRANPVRSGTINRFEISSSATDVLFDGLWGDSTALTDERNFVHGNRVAILNSRFRMKDFALSSFPANTSYPHDVIVGNCNLISYDTTQAGIRLQSVERLVFVDSRVEKNNQSTFRLHTSPEGQKSDNLYVARNQMEGGFWQIRPVPGGTAELNNTLGMGSVWVEDNEIYDTGVWSIIIGQESNNDFPEVFTCTGNNLYSGGGGFPSAGAYSWTATISGNTTNAYTAPPAWEFA